MSDDREPGQVAYEAYREAARGRSLVTGTELPEWSVAGQDVRDAWSAAASAVTRMSGRGEDAEQGIRFGEPDVV